MKKELITKNRILIDYAANCIKRKDTEDGDLEATNHARMCKKIILSCEELGFREE